ncbi:MAG: AI-2E family transporter [Phycisphaerales bacterium]|nr:AI-2E family transporter [Phycisphaerales bacterium]
MGSDGGGPAGMPPTEQGSTRDPSSVAHLHIWQIQAVRDVLIVALIVVAIWVGYALRFVTVPLLLAFTLAYLVEPLVHWICRVLKLARPLAVGLILGTFGVVIVIAGLLFVPMVVRQSSEFVDNVRAGQFDSWIDRAQDVLPKDFRDEITRVRVWTKSLASSSAAGSLAPASDANAPAAPHSGIGPTAPRLPETAVVPAASLVSDATITQTIMNPTAQAALWRLLDFSGLIFAAMLIPFYFWFFSNGFPGAIRFLGSLVPESRKKTTFRLAAEMDAAVAGFVRGRILIAAGMGVMFAVGWWINGVPYALTLGLLAGLLSIVPYLGAVVIVPAVAILAANQLSHEEAHRMAWYWIVGGPPLVFIIVQSIEGYILTPIFAGRATNLGPVSIFVAVLAGASVAGLYGMLLAIPVAACAKILIREAVMPSLRDWAAGKSADPLPLNRD